MNSRPIKDEAPKADIIAQYQKQVDDFERALFSGGSPRIEHFVPLDAVVCLPLVEELLHLEIEYRGKRGESFELIEYCDRFPLLTENPEVAERLSETIARFVQKPALGNAAFGSLPKVVVPALQTGSTDFPSAIETRTTHDSMSVNSSKDVEYPIELANFRIVRQIGEGGMGYVLEAEDIQLHRRVALKMMKPGVAEHPRARERFLREARAAASLQSDFVIPIYQVGEAAGIPFIAMPLLLGETLDARLKRIGCLPIPELLRIAREISTGLAAAHNAGLIHRDIKPSNLWLEAPHDRIRILDFGLARVLDDEPGLTASGSLLGTPMFMSPEQADGSTIDARSDLFSLGSVLYLMATGQPAFPGRTITAILRAIADHVPTNPQELNPNVSTLLLELIYWLLEKSPGRRPKSASEVAERLATIAKIGQQATRTSVAISVMQCDIREVSADIILLKHAQRFAGADLVVATQLRECNVVPKGISLSPLEGEYSLVPSKGAVRGRYVVFVGTRNLADFDYRDIRQFACRAIEVIGEKKPSIRSIAMTVHGVNLGLDAAEALQSLIFGFQQGLAKSPLPELETILLIDRDPRICTLLQSLLADIELVLPKLADVSKVVPVYVPPRKKAAYAVVPSGDELQDVYQFGIYSSVRKCGYVCERVDDSVTEKLADRIKNGIRDADFVIIELTLETPHLLFAIGCAVGLEKPILAIIREGKHIPFELQISEVISYRTISKLAETMEKRVLELFGPGEIIDR